MKKIIFMILVLTVVPMLAATAGGLPTDIKTSKGVSAAYFVNQNPAATEYSVSTGHAQGNRVFFSSSNDAKIYYNNLADGDVFTSGDLHSSHISSFESVAGSYDGAL